MTALLSFYEGPTKVCTTLADLLNILGDRRCAVVRELTKLYEQVRRSTISDQLEYFEQNEPRGEFVIIVEGQSTALQQPQFWEKAQHF